MKKLFLLLLAGGAALLAADLPADKPAAKIAGRLCVDLSL
jgi:hypothetical protein